MRRSSRNGLVAIRSTAAIHTLLAKCQSGWIRAAKITWSRGSTGSSFTCKHPSRGIFPRDLFSLLVGSLEMWRILRISLVRKLSSSLTKVLEIGNQSYFFGKLEKCCHWKHQKQQKRLEKTVEFSRLSSQLLSTVSLLRLIGLLFENLQKRSVNKTRVYVSATVFISYSRSIFRLKWLIKCYPKTWVISSMPWN